MGHCPQVLKGSVLFLERVAHRVALTEDFNVLRVNFDSLSAAERLHKITPDTNAGACSDAWENAFRFGILVHYDLNILDGRTVIQGDKCYFPVASFRSYPTFYKYFASRLHSEKILNFRTTYFCCHYA